jgi:hypothetical protein
MLENIQIFGIGMKHIRQGDVVYRLFGELVFNSMAITPKPPRGYHLITSLIMPSFDPFKILVQRHKRMTIRINRRMRLFARINLSYIESEIGVENAECTRQMAVFSSNVGVEVVTTPGKGDPHMNLGSSKSTPKT